jgi:hypothetical protein
LGGIPYALKELGKYVFYTLRGRLYHITKQKKRAHETYRVLFPIYGSVHQCLHDLIEQSLLELFGMRFFCRFMQRFFIILSNRRLKFLNDTDLSTLLQYTLKYFLTLLYFNPL